MTANALGGATVAERVFLALPAALFGFLVEARTRLALYHHRAAHGDDRLRLRLWARHPVRTARAWLWLARQSAPAFDRASAERDRLRAARDAVRLALPGRARAVRRARAGVLRELNAGRLAPAAAVAASGLLDPPRRPRAAPRRAGRRARRHRRRPRPRHGRADACVRRSLRTGRAAGRDRLRTGRAAYGDRLRTGTRPGHRRADAPAVDRAALVAGLADQIRDAISSGERWAPDYDALMERTGFRRSWCEKAVRDARTAGVQRPARRRAIRTPTPVPTRRPRWRHNQDNRPGRGSRIRAQRRAPALTRRNPHHVN